MKEITVYINSGGGDVFAAQTIGNMLERNGATVIAHIDGLCASAATIVACHADKVVAAADASYMVHPPSMGVCDYLTAEDMRNCIKALDTIRGNIVTLYAKKTGKTEDECGAWMDETNWWTASEAKENGFVDEVDGEEADAVVENRNGVLFVNSVSMGLPFAGTPYHLFGRKPLDDAESVILEPTDIGGWIMEAKAAIEDADEMNVGQAYRLSLLELNVSDTDDTENT